MEVVLMGGGLFSLLMKGSAQLKQIDDVFDALAEEQR